MGDGAELDFWMDLFRAPHFDIADGLRIEIRRYGPVYALAVGALPRARMFNQILGAAEPGAVEHEHLACAVEWMEELGVEHRVPVASGKPGTSVAEDWLNRNGFAREWGLTRFARDTSPPEFRVPPELEIDDFAEYGPMAEGFGNSAVEAFDIDPLAHLIFDSLPGREGWGCFSAIDQFEIGMGTAVLRHNDGVAQLGLAATRENYRGRGAHLALLRRRITEAAHYDCHTIFAETEERLNDRNGPSPACRNLVRAGFKQVSTRACWHSPALDGGY